MRNRRRRGGYTLVEMLIVCAVLAMVAGMSWPAVRNVLNRGRLQKAADDLQTTLRKARTHAVRAGSPIVFQYEPGGRRYRVESWQSIVGETGSESLSEDTVQSSLDSDNSLAIPFRLRGELPDGVRFATGEVSRNAAGIAPSDEFHFDPGARDTAEQRTDSNMSAAWSSPLPFHANGRSENSTIRLIDSRNFFIDVALRGLTGVVTATAASRQTDRSDDIGPLAEVEAGSEADAPETVQ